MMINNGMLQDIAKTNAEAIKGLQPRLVFGRVVVVVVVLMAVRLWLRLLMCIGVCHLCLRRFKSKRGWFLLLGWVPLRIMAIDVHLIRVSILN